MKSEPVLYFVSVFEHNNWGEINPYDLIIDSKKISGLDAFQTKYSRDQVRDLILEQVRLFEEKFKELENDKIESFLNYHFTTTHNKYEEYEGGYATKLIQTFYSRLLKRFILAYAEDQEKFCVYKDKLVILEYWLESRTINELVNIDDTNLSYIESFWPEIKISDTRFDIELDQKKIEAYFYKLATIDPITEKQILSIDDINYFLRSTFKCYKDKKEPKMFAVNGICTLEVLRKFVYNFHDKYTAKIPKSKQLWYNILRASFDVFEDTSLEQFKMKFSTINNKESFPKYLE